MGLAASQARLLLLTARKDDVEGQLMSLSNARLSLTRESAKISQQYSDALNAQKLVWKGDDGNEVDLTYNLLMRPNNISTDAGQYLVTNSSNGKVILDNSYISQLGIASSGATGDLSKSVSKQEFLEKTMNIDANTAATYVKYGSKSTAPSAPVSSGGSKGSFEGISSNTMQNLSKSWTDSKAYTMIEQYIEEGIQPTKFASESDGNLESIISDMKNLVGYLQQAASECTNSSEKSKLLGTASNLSIATSTIYYQGDGEHNWNSEDMGKLCQAISGSLAGYSSDSESGGRLNSPEYYNVASVMNDLGISGTSDDDDDDDDTPTTPSTPFVDVNKNNISDAYEAVFYLNLYDAVNSFGWQTTDNVDNQSYLQNMVTNGSIALKQLQNGGSWTSVSSSDSNTPLSSESDDDAGNEAEAKYKAENDKINYKEKQMDLKMNDLDTERSAIETEIDSVQKIIDKNIERGFKMFQNS